MPNRPHVAGGRPILVTVRLSPAEVAKLDGLRRGLSRGLGLREVLKRDSGVPVVTPPERYRRYLPPE